MGGVTHTPARLGETSGLPREHAFVVSIPPADEFEIIVGTSGDHDRDPLVRLRQEPQPGVLDGFFRIRIGRVHRFVGSQTTYKTCHTGA